MGDILKEAIADAKAVRETALENAKMALEEAFTPQLKSMLSAKLKEEEEEKESAEEMAMKDETEDEVEETEDEVEEMAMKDEDEDAVEEDDDEEPVAETIEVNGKTYRLAEEEDEEVADEGVYEEEDEDEDKLDLESIIKELEDEIGSDDDDDDDDDDVSEAVEDKDNTYAEKAPADRDGLAEGEPEAADNTYAEKAPADRDGLAEGEDDEEVEIDESVFTEDEDEEEIEEQSKSSDIGKGDNKGNYASSSDEEDPGKGKLSEQLAEYKKAVVFLKNKLHEVNILNAKLLFTNKLFKEFALDNNQKLRVVETFDRAQSTREIKLVYSTLAEQFSDNGSITRKSINESASSKSGSTKPKTKKVISEEAQVANRFKKLAGII
jgi:hypothetical protein|tara:strand:- start:779 stop:1918 length:1140 start_codon:yes stop_codon:yes gene_type:complete